MSLKLKEVYHFIEDVMLEEANCRYELAESEEEYDLAIKFKDKTYTVLAITKQALEYVDKKAKENGTSI